MRRLTVVALAMVLAGSFAASALAQGNWKKKGQTAPVPFSIGYVTVVDVNGDGGPNVNDSVKILVPETVTNASVSLVCFQGDALVYALGGYPTTFAFLLSSGAWTSGAAECTATVKWADGSKTGTVGTLTFPVGA